MAVRFGILIVLAVVMIVLICFPVSFYLRRAYDFARSEEHRVTPQSPWFFFWRKVKKPAVIFGIIYLVFMLLLAGLGVTTPHVNGEPVSLPFLFSVVQATALSFPFLAILLAAVMAALFLLPRTRSILPLLFGTFLFGILLPIILMICLALVLPKGMIMWTYSVTSSSPSGSTSMTVMAHFLPFYCVTIILLIMAGQLFSIRARGDAWFWGKEEAGPGQILQSADPE